MLLNNRNVALVGRPNVGKSRLFNRLAGKRIAIVHDQPGVTRDINTVEVDQDYTLMDTGGIGLVVDMDHQSLIGAVEDQVFVAIQAAQVICLVVDGREGCSTLDRVILENLRKFGKEPVLVINKIDNVGLESQVDEFAELGVEDQLVISAEHNIGIEDLRDKISAILGPKPEVEAVEEQPRAKICFVGRPNVGKSSLCNNLLKSDRMVVSEVPGTTRDSVEHDLDYQSEDGGTWYFRLIDTAGVRKSGRVSSSVEYFSTLRSRQSISEADIVFLVLDAMTGITKQDKSLATEILQAGKSLAIVVNKWDYALETFSREPIAGYEDEEDFRKKYTAEIRKTLFALPNCPMVFVSALTGHALEQMLSLAIDLEKRSGKKLPTPRINALLQSLIKARQPRYIKGKRFKIFYAVQTGNKPYRVRMFCNQKATLEDGYKRYLEKTMIKEFNLEGCPIFFDLVGKAARYSRGEKG